MQLDVAQQCIVGCQLGFRRVRVHADACDYAGVVLTRHDCSRNESGVLRKWWATDIGELSFVAFGEALEYQCGLRGARLALDGGAAPQLEKCTAGVWGKLHVAGEFGRVPGHDWCEVVMAKCDCSCRTPVILSYVLLKYRRSRRASWASSGGVHGLIGAWSTAPDALALPIWGNSVLGWVAGCRALEVKRPQLP